MISNAQFYFALSVPLVGILVNVVLISNLCHRIDRIVDRVARLEDRMQRCFELLIARFTRLEERLAR